MIGCEVKAIYDANGLKFDALNIVDLATGFLIPDVLDDPRCRRAPALSWAQIEPLPAKHLLEKEKKTKEELQTCQDTMYENHWTLSPSWTLARPSRSRGQVGMALAHGARDCRLGTCTKSELCVCLCGSSDVAMQ